MSRRRTVHTLVTAAVFTAIAASALTGTASAEPQIAATVRTFDSWAHGFDTIEIRERAAEQARYLMRRYEANASVTCAPTNYDTKYAQAGGGMWQVSVRLTAWCSPR
ncbi:hypothetical protein GCM10022247_66020 [Allokutzneria multivorans]|uniref:Uncharacterized protein n=1 Tax=Allokutzneria multivorans TaxID=1142134 RepID=A0ABP7TV57_9PSEU